MRAFHCPTCSQVLFFDNVTCLNCNTEVGFDPSIRDLVAVDTDRHRHCANQFVARCNWLLPVDDGNDLCVSCRLTVMRPSDSNPYHLAAFADAEAGKRNLLDQLAGLGLAIGDGQQQLAFEMKASDYERVVIGYQEGTITLDLAESDDAHREMVRQSLGEQYRTMLGHLRHEIGHFYWWLLINGTDRHDRFRAVFGDETVDYQNALDQHYDPGGRGGQAGDWRRTHVSAYAASHPWEDWAETFAHYLHIRSGLETADSFGLSVGRPSTEVGEALDMHDQTPSVQLLIENWLSLTMALNAMSRSMGQNDLYPFVLAGPVVDKLAFVHEVVGQASTT